jgi:hypothetical protein
MKLGWSMRPDAVCAGELVSVACRMDGWDGYMQCVCVYEYAVLCMGYAEVCAGNYMRYAEGII